MSRMNVSLEARAPSKRPRHERKLGLIALPLIRGRQRSGGSRPVTCFPIRARRPRRQDLIAEPGRTRLGEGKKIRLIYIFQLFRLSSSGNPVASTLKKNVQFLAQSIALQRGEPDGLAGRLRAATSCQSQTGNPRGLKVRYRHTVPTMVLLPLFRHLQQEENQYLIAASIRA